MAQRTEKAAETYRSGRARRPYALRREIVRGMGGQEVDTCGVCVACRSLMDLKDVFQSFVHSGRALMRRRAIHPKPEDTAYYDLTKQNEFLVKSVFVGKGNYVYHRDCIRAAFGVSNQRLSRLRKSVQIETNSPTELVNKQEIFSRKRFSDVVLPRNCEQPARMWLDEDVPVQCKKHPGNARKKSNCAKSDNITERFLLFVDRNSVSNGHKEGSSGKNILF